MKKPKKKERNKRGEFGDESELGPKNSKIAENIEKSEGGTAESIEDARRAFNDPDADAKAINDAVDKIDKKQIQEDGIRDVHNNKTNRPDEE